MTWTLRIGGTEKTFEQWGLSGLTKRTTSLADDTVTFVHDGQPFDAAPLFPHGSLISIRRAGTQWFYGRVDDINRRGGDNAESVTYTLAGPWWWLSRLPYQQSWTTYVNNVKTSALKTRIILFQDTAGNKIPLSGQIVAAVNYARSKGAPVQVGIIEPGATVPFQEGLDMPVGEVLQACIRWAPDCVVWFDYRTEPPTLHVQQRRNLPAVTMSIGVDDIQEINVRSREDLRIKGVELIFEIKDEVDGQAVTRVERQTAGDLADPFGVATMTFELSGDRVSLTRYDVKTDEVQAGSIEWWKKKLPWLASATDVVITDPAMTVTMPRELVAGSTPPQLDLQTQKTTVRAKFSGKISNANGAETVYDQTDLTCTIAGTKLETLVYTFKSKVDFGEEVPPGLAANFLQSTQELIWEGSLVHNGDEPHPLLYVGRVLNLSNGNPAWSNMRALIQSVTVTVDTGSTVVEFGPPPFLSVHDFLELMRVNRRRSISVRVSERITGQPTGTTISVDNGSSTPNENASTALTTSAQTLATSDGKMIKIDSSALPSGVTEMKVISVDICDAGTKRKLALLGAIYSPSA